MKQKTLLIIRKHPEILLGRKNPEEMWPVDKHRIPLLVQGKKFKGQGYFNKEFKNPQVKIDEIEVL